MVSHSVMYLSKMSFMFHNSMSFVPNKFMFGRTQQKGNGLKEGPKNGHVPRRRVLQVLKRAKPRVGESFSSSSVGSDWSGGAKRKTKKRSKKSRKRVKYNSKYLGCIVCFWNGWAVCGFVVAT